MRVPRQFVDTFAYAVPSLTGRANKAFLGARTVGLAHRMLSRLTFYLVGKLADRLGHTRLNTKSPLTRCLRPV
jgi:hypothetical protein